MESDPVAAVQVVSPHALEEPASHVSDLVSSDLLIEDVSIDGMCGVY